MNTENTNLEAQSAANTDTKNHLPSLEAVAVPVELSEPQAQMVAIVANPANDALVPAASLAVTGDDPDASLVARFAAEAQAPAPGLHSRRVEIKARAGSFLHKLTSEQKQQLFVWLAKYSIPKVADLVAQAAPDGFGLNVQETTLRRIRTLLTAAQTEDGYEDAAHAADSISEVIDSNRVDFAPVITDLLLQKTFDLTRSGGASPAELKEIVASFVKLRELELKAHRLQLQASQKQRPSSPQRHQVDVNIIPPARRQESSTVKFEVLPLASTPQEP